MSDLLKLPRFFILLLLISFPSSLAVLITPALPEIAQAFQISPAKAQWVMSIYLFGFALGPLIYGPLGNRIGRKKSLLLGIGISFLGSLLAIFGGSFWILCLGRFIQAIGGAAALKLTITMVGDLHAGHAATKTLALLLLGLAIFPCIGTMIGGFLTVFFSWKGCFVFIALYSAFMFWLSLTLPETAKQLDRKALQIRQIVRGYAAQFKDYNVTLHALMMGLTTAMVYIFANEAPYIAIDSWKMSPDQFGLFNLLLAIGMSAAMLIGNRLAGTMAARMAIFSGILVTVIGIVTMFYCLAKNQPVSWGLFLPQALVQMGGYFIWLFASSQGLSGATDKSNASAVMQFINLTTTMVGTLLIGAFVPKVAISLPIVFALLTAGLIFLWIRLRGHHQRSH